MLAVSPPNNPKVTDLDGKIANAKRLYKRKQYDELVREYLDIIDIKLGASDKSLRDDIHKFYSNLSYICYLKRDFAGGFDAATRCIEANQDWYKGYYRLAKMFESTQDYDKATTAYGDMCACIDRMDATQFTEQLKKDIALCVNDSNNVNINILREWIITNGGIIDRDAVHIEYYDVDYRGMVINSNVPKNRDLIQIPIKCAVSLEESKSRGFNKILIEKGHKFNSPHTYIALELLDIKYDPTHFKQPYIECLPKYFDNVPINFGDDERAFLKGSYALVKIQQKHQHLRLEYAGIKELVPNFPYTLEDFIWARTAIITRVYAVERSIDGVPVKDTLLSPFADMANHQIPANTHWWFNTETDMFTVRSMQYLRKGDIMYESYGQKCNYRYFVNYGFTIDNNPFEEACIIFQPLLHSIINTKLYELADGEYKNTYLDYFSTSADTFQVGYEYNNQVKKMFEYCRNKILKLEEHKDSAGTAALERNVLLMLSNTCQLQLGNFETTAEEDEQMLSMMDYSFNVRNCLVQRKEEKKVFVFFINLAKHCQLLLDKKTTVKKIFKKFLDDKTKGYKEYISYIKSLI